MGKPILGPDPLVEHLKRQGFASVRDFLEVIARFPQVLPAFARAGYLWMRDDRSLTIDSRAIADVGRLLEDQASRDVLSRVVRFRASLDAADYVHPDGAVEYFPGDVPVFDGLERLRFIDCGAFVGDTLDDLIDHTPVPVDIVASFEPDRANLSRLAEAVVRLRRSSPECRFLLYPCGAWSEIGLIGFAGGGSSSSRLEEAGGEAVPVVCLDLAVSGMAPNFIKLDIEGAEMQALDGARGIITEFRPHLAVCVYHRPADLWEIPLAISAMRPDYRFFLRQHGHMGTGLVLYAL